MDQEVGSPGKAYKWLVLVAISIANFSAALDMSIIIVSFPRLTDVFDTDASVVIWLAIAFSIAELGLLLTLAKVGDTIGRKKVYIVGLALYTVGMILCSISPNITVLILSRVVQGAGAAMTLTVGSAIVVAVFPREQQGQAIGMFAMLTAVGLIAGPALGGVILDALDWQGIFYTRIPVGIICLVMALVIVREQKEPGAQLHLDYGGAVTLLTGMSGFLLYLNLGGGRGYLSPGMVVLLAGSIVLLGVFIYLERRVVQPVLDLRFFRNRAFSMAGLTSMIQMSAGSMCPVLIPFFLTGALLLSPSTIGMLMAIIAVPPVIISPLSGWLSDKIGNRVPMVFATVCFSAALFFASRLDVESETLHIALILLLFGVGMGLFTAPNQSAMIGTVPRSNLASAMGVANAMRLLGSSIGTAIGGTLYAYRLSYNQGLIGAPDVAPGMAERIAVAESFQYVILLAAFISVVSILTALSTGRQEKNRDAV